MIPFPNKKYSIIYADPPWFFRNRQPISTIKFRKNVHISERYPVMQTEEIKKLKVQEICEPNCVLFIWTTGVHVPHAIEVIKAWGFKYKTLAFVWRKLTKTKKCAVNMGMWTMPSTELCLLAIKGKPHELLISRKVRQYTETIRREHSQKPDEVRNKIVDMFGDLPKIELFARDRYEGWDVWGNEILSEEDFLLS